MMTNIKKYGLLLTGLVTMSLSLVFALSLLRPVHKVSDGKRSQNDSLNAVFQKCIDNHFQTLETYVNTNDSIELLGHLKDEYDSISKSNDSLSRTLLIQLSDSAHAIVVREKLDTYIQDSLTPMILRKNEAASKSASIEKSVNELRTTIQREQADTARLQKEINQLKDELRNVGQGKGKTKNKKQNENDSIRNMKDSLVKSKLDIITAMSNKLAAEKNQEAKLTEEWDKAKQTEKEQQDRLVDFIHRAVNDYIPLKTVDENKTLNQCITAIATAHAKKAESASISKIISSLKNKREVLTGAYKDALSAISKQVFVDSIPINAKKFRLRSGGPMYSLYVVNTTRMDMRIDDNIGRGATLLTQYKKLQTEGIEPIAMMNGGMFDPDYGPTGLLITPQKHYELNQQPGTGNFYLNPNGVFVIDQKGKGSIMKTAEFVTKYAYKSKKPLPKKVGDIKYATQSGPMLVINGKINKLFTKGSTNLNIRNGVGTFSSPDRTNYVLMLISEEKTNFYDFSFIFQSLGAEHALYLDGFVSRLYFKETPDSKATPDNTQTLGPIISVSAKK